MRVFVLVIVTLHIVPFLITQLILVYNLSPYNKNQQQQKLTVGTLLNIVLNGICLCSIYDFVYKIRNPFKKILKIILLRCSYQDIGRMGKILAVSIIVSFFVGYGIVFLLKRDIPELSKAKASLTVLIAVITIIPIIEALKISEDGISNIRISEVCRKTEVDNEDNLDGDYSYITIKNIGSLSCEIKRMYLMDNEEGEGKVLIQNITLGTDEEYLYMMASDEGLDIKKKGGTIVYLADNNGNIIDNLTVPALSNDESYRLVGGEWNVVSLIEETTIVPSPEFSVEGGFYDEAFELSISAQDGLKIYYTIDSSNPTETSKLYTSPIYVYDKSEEPNQYRSIQNVYRTYLENKPIGQTPVDKCFVVRAVAIDIDGNMSDIVTKSYFVGLDKYKGKRVISLVSDPDGLFGEDGIYVTGLEYDEWYENAFKNTPEGEEIDTTGMPSENYNQHGIEWERLANIELFEAGENVNNQFVGIRVQGGSHRYGVALKRFSIYSRRKYSGSKWFDMDFFENTKSHSIVIREGDANVISQRLASDRAAMNIIADQIVLFLDGEYWYTSYMYEKLSEKYYAEHYDVSDNNVIMSRDGKTITSGTETKETFEYLSDFVKTNSLVDDGNYHELQDKIDIQSFIDYWAINIYLGNMDVCEGKNIVAWKTEIKENEQYGDNKWRWVFYDMDLALTNTRWDMDNVDINAEVNSFNVRGKWVSNAIDEGTFWKALVVRDDFCKQFVLSFMDIANTNFSLSNVEKVLEEYGYDISYDDYFFQERPKYIFQYLAEEFKLTGTQETVTLSSNISGSPITLNTITPELSDDGTWSGTYFTDYPITVTATSSDFDHWEVTSGEQTKRYTDLTINVPVVEGGVEIYAVFK